MNDRASINDTARAGPKFTIITSTFNAADCLPLTARSLAVQRYRNFEWIIIDGASSDATVGVARGYGELVSTLISEKDSGIYSAWNKALPLIKGDWVLFLGAGDSLFSDSVLDEICAELRGVSDEITTVYGNVTVFSDMPGKGETVRSDTWRGLRGPWVAGRPELPCHQGVFQRASLFRSGFQFDTRCKISADNEILLRELVGGRGKKVNVMVARFHADGISAQRKKRLQMVAESIFINYKLGIFRNRPLYQTSVLASNAAKHVLRLLGHKTI